MKPIRIPMFVIVAALAALLQLPVFAANVLTYATKSSFTADLQSGYFLNDFSVLPSGVAQNDFNTPYHNVGFTNGSPAVGYELEPGGGNFFTDYPINCASTWSPNATIVVTFTTTNVVTVGAEFFLTDFNGNPYAGSVTVTAYFTDSTSASGTVTSTTSTTSFGFFGISSDTPISYLTVSPSANFATVGNFYVSSKASVPSTTVSVVATTPNASQAGPTPGVFTLTRANVNSDYSTALPVKFVLSGTATNGVYTCAPGGITAAATNTVTIAAGQLSTNITINPVVNSISRPTTTVLLSVIRGTGYAPNAPSSDTVSIQNTGPQLLIVSADQSSMYNGLTNDYASVTLTRWGNTNAAAYSVNSFTYSGTATANTHFVPAAALIINPGDVTVSAKVTPLRPTTSYVGNKTIVVGLTSSGGYTAATNTTTLTIVDAANPVASLLYSNSLTSADDATNWNITAANNNLDSVAPDSTVDFGNDLTANNPNSSTYGVIPAPPSGATNALRLTVNKNSGAAAAVNLYLTNVVLSGDFAVRFDMNLIEGSNPSYTTEGALFGINHSGNLTNWWSGSSIISQGPWAGDGIWYWVSADGGAGGGDYISFTGTGSPNTNTLRLASRIKSSFAGVLKNPAPYSTSGGAGLAANNTPLLGNDASAWSAVEIKQVKNVVTFSINKNPILVYTNVTVWTNGYLMLGYSDPYNSIGSADAAVYYSNLRVVRLAGPKITGITAGSNVSLNFTTTDGTDTTTSFAVQSSSGVGGTYTDLAPQPVITQSATGVFQATVPKSGNIQFYRIRHK